MEDLSLEEKIASFRQKMDQLDPAAFASGGPQKDLSVSMEVEKKNENNSEEGEIYDLENTLVHKVLSVEGGNPDAANTTAVDQANEDESTPKASEAEKAAIIAAGFEIGNISPMKDALVSKRTINTAHKGDVKNTGTAGDETAFGGSYDGAEAPTVSTEQPERGDVNNEIGGLPSVTGAINGHHGNVDSATVEKEWTPIPPTAVLNGVDLTVVSEEQPAESHSVLPVEASGVGNITSEPKERRNEFQDVVTGEAPDVGEKSAKSDEGKYSVPPETTDHCKKAVQSQKQGKEYFPAMSLEASELPEEARRQGSFADAPAPPASAATGEKQERKEPSSDAEFMPVSLATKTPNDAAPVFASVPNQNGNELPAAGVVATAPISTTAPTAALKGKEDAAEHATGFSSRVKSSNEPSKAKAARAAAKARSPSMSQLNTQRQRQQRRQSLPHNRNIMHTAASVNNSAHAEGAEANPSMKQATSLSSPSEVIAARRLSERNRAARHVLPTGGSISRSTSAPVTPGLHASPFVTSSGPTDEHRRSFTPAKKRASTPSQQQAVPNSAHLAADASRAVAMTPSSAEEAGIRMHDLARQSRERLERRMKEGVTPPFFGTGSSNVSPAVMTPTSAERSGHRLHEQAREARERLERRRKEMASSPLSSFTPRLWSNPRMGNPSVAGLERLENLYRDAIQRTSKLEIARRAAERPGECTFTPEISKRAASRSRSMGGKRMSRGYDSAGPSSGEGKKISTFDALYLDAKRRRAKIDALCGAHMKETIVRASPVITARGRQASVVPIEVRMKENAERWVRRWKELEEKKIQLEQRGCTFRPSFSMGRSASAPRMRPRRENGAGGSGSQGASFVERSYMFQVEREKKMEKLKQEAMEKERAEATFQPKLTSREGGDVGEARTDVFERLLKAATVQEAKKAALKEQLWKQELEKYHDFKPQLPSKGSEGPSAPLEARIQKSTQDWIKNRARREHRRRELEAEQCTFRPSLGGGIRRSASLEPRLHARSPRSTPSERNGSRASLAAALAPGAYAAQSIALQDAREERLKKMKDEKITLEHEEATVQAVTENNTRAINIGRGSGGGGGGDGAYASAVEAARVEREEEKQRHNVPIPVPETAAARSAAIAPKKASTKGVDMQELSARLQELAAAEGFLDADETQDVASPCAVAALVSHDAVKQLLSENHPGGDDVAPLALVDHPGEDDVSRRSEKKEEQDVERVSKPEGDEQEDDHYDEEPEDAIEIAAEETAMDAVDANPVPGGNYFASSICERETEVPAGVDGAMHADFQEGVEVAGVEDYGGNEGQYQPAGVHAAESLKAMTLSSGADDSAAEEEFAFKQRDVQQAAAGEEEEKETDDQTEGTHGADGENLLLGLQRQSLQDEEEEKEKIEEKKEVEDKEEEGRHDGNDENSDQGKEDDVDEGDTEDDGDGDSGGYGVEEGMGEEGDGDGDYDDDIEDCEYDDDDDDDVYSGEDFSFINPSYASNDPTSQTSRSLEDFDRAQREIAAKLRAL